MDPWIHGSAAGAAARAAAGAAAGAAASAAAVCIYYVLGGICLKQGKSGTREDGLRAQGRALKIYLYRRGSASPDRRKIERQVAKIAS